MRQPSLYSSYVFAAFVLFSHSISGAQEGSSFERYAEQAAKYRITIGESNRELRLVETPLLNYSNPVRHGGDGSVFLWTDASVPAVVGTCFTYVYQGETRRKNAFQVLANEPIQASFDDSLIWSPPAESLAFRPIPGAPTPASASRQRETQLKGMARQFSAEITNRDGRVEQCRLMSKPLHTYETERRSGALFAFAVGTDPEAILWIDRMQSDQGKLHWQYAWARFTFYPVAGSHQGREVWRVAGSENLLRSIFDRPDYQRQPYITFRPEYLD